MMMAESDVARHRDIRSQLGIQIGSPARDVMAQYGPPSRQLETIRGHSWSYDQHRIAFQIRDDRVMSWIVY